MAAKKTPKKAVKKTARKTSKKTPKKAVKKTAKKESQAQSVIGLIALVVIAAVLLYYGITNLMGEPESIEPTVQPDIAATVDGVEITTEQLTTQYAILPDQYKAIYTEDMILEQLISEELLIAYGKDQGLTVNEEAVNEEIQRVLSTGQLTITELQDNLANFNLTIEDFEQLIERKLLIELSMAALLQDMPAVSEEDARAYYDANAAQYVTEEQVTARHILIASQREDAAQFSKDLMEQIQDGADFCELVTAETDDKGSVATCGEYTFPRGYMVPEFEKAAFELAPGEMTIVQTTFGYHIIEKIADVPGGVVEFADVKDDILVRLEQEADVVAYQEFLTEAKADADIQVFYDSE